MSKRPRFHASLLTGALVLMSSFIACGSDTNPTVPLPGLEWVPVPFSVPPAGVDAINVAVLRPEGPPKGVIMAFPWGSGISELVISLLDSYWDEAALDAGYVVLGVEAFGPGFETLGPIVMPDVLAWIGQTFPSAVDDIVMVGASNGGRGVFHAALSVPADRVQGIIAMPGEYTGDPASFEPLASVPVWLMVGENDTGWVTAAESTRTALEGAGLTVRLDILPGQDHVLDVPQQDLVDWIEAR